MMTQSVCSVIPSPAPRIGILPSLLLAMVMPIMPAIAQVPDLTNGGVPGNTRYINLGPTGMEGWMYNSDTHPRTLLGDLNYTGQSRQILVTAVAAGSPAALAGILIDDVILGASGDGSTPVDFSSDARKSLALAIAAAEARTTPELKLKVWRGGSTSTHTLTLQNLGAYGPDAPISDAKCDLIVENARQALLAEDKSGTYGMGTLALMSLDDPAHSDHPAMKAQIDAEIAALLPVGGVLPSVDKAGWQRGHTLIVLAEYYLTYGEHPNGGVFQAIEAYTNAITEGQSIFGTFGHIFAQFRWPDGDTRPMMGGYGAINSSAVPGLYGLMLAKECGVVNPALDVSIDRGLTFYGSYAGRGAIPYGEHTPAGNEFSTNGKSGAAALVFDLATGKEEECKYFAKMSAAAFHEYETGHTGPFFQNIWSPLGAAHAGDDAIKSYFAQTSWLYDLARKWDGSFAYNHITTHDNYTNFNSSTPYVLTYALPLKRLHMTGRGRVAGVLNAAEIAEAVLSANYDETTRTKAQLIADLADWSGPVHGRAANALAGMSLTTTDMDTIHALASDPQGTSREGALLALEKIADPSSAPVLAAILSDPDPHIRRLAANALIWNPAKAGELNAVLAAAGAAIRPVFPMDPRDPLQHDLHSMGLLLFSNDTNPPERGILYQYPNIVLDGVDRELLYPAIRAIASSSSGSGRSTLSAVMPALDPADVAELGDVLVDTAFYRAPADPMFADPARQSSMDVLTANRFAEAIPVAARSIRADPANGNRALYGQMFVDLQQFGETNLRVTPDPDVTKLCLDFIAQNHGKFGYDDNLAKAQALLDAIATDDEPAPPIYLKSFDWVVSDAAELTLPANQTQLHASVTDHAKGDLTYTWRKVYGAGDVTFSENGTATSKDVTITFDNTPGNYLFEVVVVDARNLSEITETVAVTLYDTGGTLPSNQPPSAVAQGVTAAPGTPTPITLTGTDPESAPLVFTVTRLPIHGTLSGTAPNLTYTSDATYHTGTDSLGFTVTDSFGQTSTEATVTITVDPAQLEVHVYEPFDYPANSGLAGATGGTGMTGSWQNGPEGPGIAFIYDENGKAGGQPDWDGVMDGYPMQPVGGSRYVAGDANDATFESYRPLAQNAAQMAGPDGELWMSGVWHFPYLNFGAHVGLALATDSMKDRGRQLDTSVNFGSGAGDGIGVGRGTVSANNLAPMFFDGGTIAAQNQGQTLYAKDWVVVLRFQFGATDTVSAYAFPEGLPIDKGVFERNAVSTTHVIDESTLNILTFSQNRKENAIDEIRIGSSFAAVVGLATSAEDVTPPTPDPMTFASAPAASGTSSITMTATTAADPSGVEYYFACTSGNGHDSGWQDSPTYTDMGLGAGSYTYTVKARDKGANRNETAPSAPGAATLAGSTPGVISWEVFDILGNVNEVSTAGTPVQAHAGADLGTGNVVDGTTMTINGVTFDDGFVFDTPSHLDTIGSRAGANTSGDYRILLQTADRQGSGTATFTFNGLTPGNTYQIQVWHSDNISTAQTSGMVLNTGGTASVPTFGTSGHATVLREVTEGNAGQYAIGTFVAGATSQQFLARAYGNLTTTPTPQTNITINACQLRQLASGSAPDQTPPTLSSSDIVDNQAGGPVDPGTVVEYDVTFSEDMDPSTISHTDFGNAGTSLVTIGTVVRISPRIFRVRMGTLTPGTLQLRVNQGAVLADLAGNHLDTASAILDDTVLTVATPNSAPTWSSNPVNEANAIEDAAYSATLADDASDANGNTLEYAKVSGPAWLVVATDGSLSGVPGNADVGLNVFTVSVTDNIAPPVEATLNITVINTNDAPVAANGSAATDEDTPVAVTLVASDIDSAIQSYTVVTAPTNGTLGGTAPNLTYTPNADFNGADSFTFKANDGLLDSNTATISLTVNPVNDAPVALNGTATTDEDVAVAITLEATDIDSTIADYTVVTAPANGTLSGTGPNLTYTPNSGFSGSDSFTFTASDGSLDSNEATISITVEEAELVPGVIHWSVFDITGDVADVSTEGTLVQAHAGADMGTGNVVDGTTLTINGVTFDDGFVFDSPSHLDTIGNRAGANTSGVYRTLLQFADRQGSGTATFTFTGLIIGSTYQIQVWHSDNVSAARDNGMVLNTGGITDIPTIGTSGHVTVLREVSEANAGQYAIGTFVAAATSQQFLAKAYGSLTGSPTAQANITINACQLRLVAAGPDSTPPTLAGSDIVDDQSGANVIENDLVTYTVTFSEDMDAATVDAMDFSNAGTAPVTIGTITESSPGVFTVEVTPTAAGTLQLQIAAGATLTDALGNALDTTVAIADDTIITVDEANIAPIWTANPVNEADATEDSAYASTLADDASDGNIGDSLEFAKLSGPSWLNVAPDGTLSGTPANGDVGLNTFTVGVTDNIAAPVYATLNITVINVNDPPAFVSDPIAGGDATEDTAYGGTLAGSASDDDGNDLVYAKVSGPAWLNVAPDGTLSGTPGNGDVGPNGFTVSVTDNIAAPVQAGFVITVVNTNDAPAWSGNPITGANATEDATYSGNLAASASDVDAGANLSFAKVSGPAWLSVAPNGSLSGMPINSDVGANSFTVTVSDGIAPPVEATLNITVDNTNDAPTWSVNPVGGADAAEDSSYSGTLAGSAGDVDAGANLTYAKVSGPAWLTVGNDGALGGTPVNSDVGANSFTVSVSDGIASAVEATLNITVTNTNDAPTWASNPVTGTSATEDAAYSGSLASSASDADTGANLTFAKVSGPPWLNVASNGALSGTPANGDVGANSFTVSVSDGIAAAVTTTLDITVTNTNDAPVFTVDPIVAVGGSEGVAYTGVTLAGSATDADAGDTITYSKVSGPEWLAVAPDGALTGTPPSGSAGLNSFIVRATDTNSATADATLEITVAGLPLPWVSTNIGTGMLAGSASHNAGTFTQAGSGVIAGTSDKLRYTYQTISGDGEIIARISSLENTGTSARVGVMIRESLATNSKQIFMGLNGSGGYRWMRRSSTGGNPSTSNNGSGTVPNTWVRIVRTGSTIASYKSSNGTSWTLVNSSTGTTFASTCYIGLAVGSGSDTTLNTSQFSNVSVTP